MKTKKKTLVLDFDGVIHSYTSGWKGACVIPDEPVPGALEFIANATDHFQVAILSSRSHQWGGRRAMRRWLLDCLRKNALMYDDCPQWLRDRITAQSFADPWVDDVRYVTKQIVSKISWPLYKPAAYLTIDDRAITFTGEWPSMSDIISFKPWNKR